MICSMTGFGQAELQVNDTKITAELSSLNNRFFEVQFRMPRKLACHEPKIKELLNTRVKRGKVVCIVNWDSGLASAPDLKLNEPAAKMYSDLFEQVKKRLDVGGELKFSDLVSLEGLFAPVEESTDKSAELEMLETVVGEALSNLHEMRLQEGERLAADMRPRIGSIGAAVDRIRGLVGESVEAHRERLETRVKELLAEQTDLGERIAIEAAVVAERCDVTEECVRIESHNEQFLDTLNETEPVGKRLNFILQELNREANTIGSKSMSTGISREVIFLKEEIEKLREQVQNVE